MGWITKQTNFWFNKCKLLKIPKHVSELMQITHTQKWQTKNDLEPWCKQTSAQNKLGTSDSISSFIQPPRSHLLAAHPLNHLAWCNIKCFHQTHTATSSPAHTSSTSFLPWINHPETNLHHISSMPTNLIIDLSMLSN